MYLCISTYNSINDFVSISRVVNCFKMCIFALARTTLCQQVERWQCCELLQNVYLCISTYNRWLEDGQLDSVVNCFKMCIFALARTTIREGKYLSYRCELLQNVYLCISTYNKGFAKSWFPNVVNCFKMCIFALARTTRQRRRRNSSELWIASKCVSLH